VVAATAIVVALNNVSSAVSGGTSNSDSSATTTNTSAITVTIGDVGFDMAFLEASGTAPAVGTGGTSIRTGTLQGKQESQEIIHLTLH
jgi:hypothetical protein